MRIDKNGWGLCCECGEILKPREVARHKLADGSCRPVKPLPDAPPVDEDRMHAGSE